MLIRGEEEKEKKVKEKRGQRERINRKKKQLYVVNEYPVRHNSR